MSILTEDMVFPSHWSEDRIRKAKRILARLPYNRHARKLDRQRCYEIAFELERKERKRKFEAQHAPAYAALGERIKEVDAVYAKLKREHR